MKAAKHIFVCFTTILILFPSGISFAHVFSEHNHKMCDNYAEQHVHEKSVECELHKFHNNPALQIDFQNIDLSENLKQEKPIFNYYRFLSDYQRLPFQLRGPPFVI